MAAAWIAIPPKLSDHAQSDPVARALALKYREIRLHALKTDPNAFGSSYDLEVQTDLDQWLERLKKPSADHLFALDREVIAYTHDTADKYFHDLLEARWIGFVVLVGPIAQTMESLFAKSGPFGHLVTDEATSSSEPLHFKLTGTFVDPAFRGAGLGRALINAAIAKAVAQAERHHAEVHLTVWVWEDNAVARALYEKAGFRLTGRDDSGGHPRPSRPSEGQPTSRHALQMSLTRIYGDGNDGASR